MKCKGFLFDLDGTLVDSLGAVERAWSNWAIAHQLEPAEVMAFIHGKQAITSLRHFLPDATEAELAAESAELERIESTDTEGVVALPGALAFLARLNELQVPWAIVTSGTIPVAHARHAAGGLPQPEYFITAEQITHGKPAPDPYLKGASVLGLAPEHCTVVEDAPSGIASGLAAQCHVIAVNQHQVSPLIDRVDFVAESLAEVIIQPCGDGWFNVVLNAG